VERAAKNEEETIICYILQNKGKGIKMRSIGVKNVNAVKRLTKKAIKNRTMPWGEISGYATIEDEVVDQLPVELWDTWEMADQQIRNIINDVIMEGA